MSLVELSAMPQHESLLKVKEILKPNTMIPNPVIQLQEDDNLINNSPHHGYFAQAWGASFVRMALSAAVVGLL